MRLIRFHEAQRYEPQPQWARLSLCDEPGISMEHFTKPANHVSPRHHHTNVQVIALLSGQLIVHSDHFEDQWMQAGDVLTIPSDEPHWVANPLAEPAVGLDIFVPGRPFTFWLSQLQG